MVKVKSTEAVICKKKIEPTELFRVIDYTLLKKKVQKEYIGRYFLEVNRVVGVEKINTTVGQKM